MNPGTVVHYVTRTGARASAYPAGEKSYLPVFCVEVVDAAGEVIECFDVTGAYALATTAERRGWREIRR